MKRVDANQVEVVKALRQVGAEWIPCSEATDCGFDGITLWRGRSLICEIKDGNKPPSQRKLTDNEEKTKAKCEARGVPYLILTSPIQAVETLAEFH